MDGLFAESEAFGHSLMCLPSELLALCLCRLPFRDRIGISHVSRFWRSISLAHPTIWASIDLSGNYKDQHMLLSMALSRTGIHPVFISGPYKFDPEGVVSQCLREHLHHVKRIVMDLPEDSLPLDLPAPALVEVVSMMYHIDIPVDFLGGQPARLQILDLATVSLPAVCPALSAVTNLTLDGPTRHEDAVTYGRLFDLCPRLTALSLHDLDAEFHNLLPRGRAPSFLRKLFLITDYSGYDLIAHFLDWRTDSLRDVRLEQESIPELAGLTQFVAGATALKIAIYYERKTTQLTARHDAAGRKHSVRFSHAANDAADVADLLFRTKDALRALTQIEVPLAALEVFLPVLAAFPDLAHLVLRIRFRYPVGVGGSAHEISWDHLLPGILRATERCASLREIVLHVVCPDLRCPPTPQDAHRLADRVLELGRRGGLPGKLVIKGSTGDVFEPEDSDIDRPRDPAFEFSYLCP